MTIFARLWSSLSGFFSHLWSENGPAILAWGKQFLTDEGQVIFADAAEYGPQIFAKTITITEAATKLMADLKAKGMADVDALEAIIFNALRTHTNLAATADTNAAT